MQLLGSALDLGPSLLSPPHWLQCHVGLSPWGSLMTRAMLRDGRAGRQKEPGSWPQEATLLSLDFAGCYEGGKGRKRRNINFLKPVLCLFLLFPTNLPLMPKKRSQSQNMPSWNASPLFSFTWLIPDQAPKHSVDVASFWPQSLKTEQGVFALASEVSFSCWRQVCFLH